MPGFFVCWFRWFVCFFHSTIQVVRPSSLYLQCSCLIYTAKLKAMKQTWQYLVKLLGYFTNHPKGQFIFHLHIQGQVEGATGPGGKPKHPTLQLLLGGGSRGFPRPDQRGFVFPPGSSGSALGFPASPVGCAPKKSSKRSNQETSWLHAWATSADSCSCGGEAALRRIEYLYHSESWSLKAIWF